MTLIFNLIFIPVLITLLVIVSQLIGSFTWPLQDAEKISTFECGFNPIETVRSKFDISFYLIGILFIVFDIEILFLYPGILALEYINLFGYSIFMIFIILLTIGFIFEWKSGALNF